MTAELQTRTRPLQVVRSEEPLLARVARREADAIEACIDRFGGLVNSLARRFFSELSDVEEVVQDIFSEVWRAAHRYDVAVASEKTFIAMIARRRLIDRRRRVGAAPRHESLAEPASVEAKAPTEDPLELSDEVQRVTTAMAALKPHQRSAIQLAVVEGLSHTEVAQALNQPLGTIKSNIRRGLLRLRELLTGMPEGRLAQ